MVTRFGMRLCTLKCFLKSPSSVSKKYETQFLVIRPELLTLPVDKTKRETLRYAIEFTR